MVMLRPRRLLLALLLRSGLAMPHYDGSDYSCALDNSCPACNADARSVQRVRQELRTLSSTEWTRVVDAMWIMKNTSNAYGAARYGPAFRSYDTFVLKHAVASTHARGDQAHFGPAFATWHAAFVLEFENSLLSIDSTIGACPYWNCHRLPL